MKDYSVLAAALPRATAAAASATIAAAAAPALRPGPPPPTSTASKAVFCVLDGSAGGSLEVAVVVSSLSRLGRSLRELVVRNSEGPVLLASTSPER